MKWRIFGGVMKRILILTVFILPIQSAGAALIDGLQLHAPFDGNADDMSGNGNNGIVYNAVLTADKNGYPDSAYHFNGVDSYIDFGTSDLDLTGSSEITFCAWVKPDQPTTYHSHVLSSEPYYRPFALKTRGRGSAVTAQCAVRTVDGGAYIEGEVGGIVIGNWYHILCRYDGSIASIYVDGELRNSVSLSGLLNIRSQHILAGANPNNPPKSFFHGAIDDIRIWNRALSEDEIIEVYSGEPAECVDADGDGWYSTAICNDGILYDCLDDPEADPYAPFVNPGVTETYDLCSNGYDDDCVDGDLICDDCPLDNDNPVSQRCLCESEPVETGYCCSDGTYSLNPCDEAPVAVDNDEDGWYSDGQFNLDGLPDCDDNNPLIFPLNTNNYCDCDDSDGVDQGTVEICGNGIDEDCDGFDLPCTADIVVGGYEVNHDFDGICDECLDLIRTKRILLGTRSIGLATMAGLRNLADDPRYDLTIEQYFIPNGEIIPDDAFNDPKLVHFIYNLSPMEERWAAFESYIRSNYDKIDVAFLYLYSTSYSELYTLYDSYTQVFDSLKNDFPNINFVIATHTLDTRTTPEGRFNFYGKLYSEQIREDYTGVVPIYDLGDIESTRSDDSICEFEYDGIVYRRMCPEYNINGDHIHPNSEEAMERLGKGIFVLMSKIFCEQQPEPAECTHDSDCDDNLACNGQETCVNEVCVEGTPIDCSTYDIASVETCNNDPDSNPLTWDYGPAFTSQCIEPGICTTGEQVITSTCSVSQCGAECDEANPCPSTECDGLDGCVGDDYYDYHDVENNCLDDCTCEENPCESLTIYPDDARCTANPVDESLKLYAPFDGNADDMSGNGNNGIVYNAVLTEDRNGNPDSAYQFNGVDSYIDFGTSDLGLAGGDEITFSAWIKPDQPTAYNSHVLSSEPYYRPYMLKTRGRSSAVSAQCAVRTVGGGSYIGGDTGGIIVGNWYHIACTYDGASVSIYVDGGLQNSVSLSGLLNIRSQHILAGANPTSPPSGFFNGAIDDIRIWNRSLSASEVQALQYE
ncbi:MAG: LamG domain-containing protein [Planctomycetota bacterium]|jgi:hypothetical protein